MHYWIFDMIGGQSSSENIYDNLFKPSIWNISIFTMRRYEKLNIIYRNMDYVSYHKISDLNMLISHAGVAFVFFPVLDLI